MTDVWKDKHVLVTGGNGFLGSHVVEKLRARGAEVLSPRRDGAGGCDWRYPNEACCYVKNHKPDIIIHLAATCGGIGANQRYPVQFAQDNLLMGINLMAASQIFDVQKLVFLGTTCSYPANAPLPLKEEDIWNGYPEPTNAPYGIAKRTLLTMAQAYRQQYGLNSIYLIPANLYGPRDHFDSETSHVIPAIIRKCVEAVIQGQEAVSLWGDGTPTREFLYVEDCAEAILLAAERYDGAEPVNIGNGQEWAIEDVAQIIADATGFEGVFCWDKSKPNGQRRRCLRTHRAKTLFDFEAKTGLIDGICQTIKWYLTQVVHPDSVGLPVSERVRSAV